MTPAVKATAFVGIILFICAAFLGVVWLAFGPHIAAAITLVVLIAISWYTSYLVELDIKKGKH